MRVSTTLVAIAAAAAAIVPVSAEPLNNLEIQDIVPIMKAMSSSAGRRAWSSRHSRREPINIVQLGPGLETGGSSYDAQTGRSSCWGTGCAHPVHRREPIDLGPGIETGGSWYDTKTGRHGCWGTGCAHPVHRREPIDLGPGIETGGSWYDTKTGRHGCWGTGCANPVQRREPVSLSDLGPGPETGFTGSTPRLASGAVGAPDARILFSDGDPSTCPICCSFVGEMTWTMVRAWSYLHLCVNVCRNEMEWEV